MVIDTAHFEHGNLFNMCVSHSTPFLNFQMTDKIFKLYNIDRFIHVNMSEVKRNNFKNKISLWKKRPNFCLILHWNIQMVMKWIFDWNDIWIKGVMPLFNNCNFWTKILLIYLTAVHCVYASLVCPITDNAL